MTDRVLVYDCPPELIAYDRATRETHRLLPPVSHLYRLLRSLNGDDAPDSHELASRLRQHHQLTFHPEQIDEALEQLKRIQLIG